MRKQANKSSQKNQTVLPSRLSLFVLLSFQIDVRPTRTSQNMFLLLRVMFASNLFYLKKSWNIGQGGIFMVDLKKNWDEDCISDMVKEILWKRTVNAVDRETTEQENNSSCKKADNLHCQEEEEDFWGSSRRTAELDLGWATKIL